MVTLGIAQSCMAIGAQDDGHAVICFSGDMMKLQCTPIRVAAVAACRLV
jgi:hypothetical protein